MTLADYRALFPLPEGTVYLDHAATGTVGRPALDAVTDYLAGRAGRLPGRSPNNYPADLDRADRARQRAATVLGVPTEMVALVPNTSYGLNLVAQGLDWRPGDRVAVPDCEFPANRLPWLGLADRGVAVDTIAHRQGVFSVDDVAAALRPETRIVTVSAVQFLSGFRCDLASIGQLCRDRGVLFVVDAIQAVGAVRVDAAAVGADLVATGGHKWIGAMQGAGVAAVTAELQDRLRPTRGWLNGPVDWDDFDRVSLDLHPDATRFHVGTGPTAQIYALDAALGAYLDVGPEVVEEAVLSSAARLAEGLDRLGFVRYGEPGAPRSGIVTVRADDPEGLHAHLAERGVTCSMRSRLVRFAPHAQTPPDAIDATLDAVASFRAVAA
ncbi:aminotransferase class V-fold PLP-dependent enzyme [Rubrivirga sp.]|uniref:aminotransferase class V-fold PLP-dependent enzyme n=1 Tax=Rubrivirga sp. TaxID=1885344 RepID=UPI003B52CB10